MAVTTLASPVRPPADTPAPEGLPEPGAAAVALAVAYATVTLWLLATERLTVKVALVVPAFPSATDTLPMVSTGSVSSLLMVPVACVRASVAPDGALKATRNVSSDSTAVSPLTGTATVVVVEPTANVAVPLTAV